MTTTHRPLLWQLALLTAIFPLVLAGCGESTGPQGTLHGKVTLKGAAVPAGSSISFSGDKGAGVAEIDAAGNYALKKPIPVGQYTAVVVAAASKLSPEEAMKASMAGKAVDAGGGGIPEKYRLPTTSPAKVEVKSGDTEFNLDMTDA